MELLTAWSDPGSAWGVALISPSGVPIGPSISSFNVSMLSTYGDAVASDVFLMFLKNFFMVYTSFLLTFTYTNYITYFQGARIPKSADGADVVDNRRQTSYIYEGNQT